jgi:tRNA-(ms[2]io[6]A)-hydroxylase
MYRLRIATSPDWTEAALANFDDFLIGRATKKKASGVALSMLSHYADKPDIVSAMTHFHEMVKIPYGRGLHLGDDY